MTENLFADFAAMQPGRRPTRLKILAASFGHPGTLCAVILRSQCLAHDKGMGKIANFLRVLNLALTGADFAPGCAIGGGLRILHPNGVVVGHRVVIGRDCTILQQVTLGESRVNGGHAHYPVIGDRVTLAAGAKVLGNVRVGDDCVVGANSVVLRDLPSGSVAVGAPARIVG